MEAVGFLHEVGNDLPEYTELDPTSSHRRCRSSAFICAIQRDPIDQKYGPRGGGAHLSGLPVRAKYSPRPVLIYSFECQLLRDSSFCSELAEETFLP